MFSKNQYISLLDISKPLMLFTDILIQISLTQMLFNKKLQLFTELIVSCSVHVVVSINLFFSNILIKSFTMAVESTVYDI